MHCGWLILSARGRLELGSTGNDTGNEPHLAVGLDEKRVVSIVVGQTLNGSVFEKEYLQEESGKASQGIRFSTPERR